MTKQHESKQHETYNAEAITTELRRGNSQEAARELNRDLHGSKDFQKIYSQVNEQIDKLNATKHLNLPHIELTDDKGNATTDKNNAKGIKIGDTTYDTNTVRNNKTVDDKTGNQTVRSGDSVKTLDKNGNEVSTDPEGKTTTKYAEANKPTDKDIGKVKSETRDGQGNRVLEGDNGCTKTIDKDGKETMDYTDGSRVVNRPDGTGCKLWKDADGTKHVMSWSGKTQDPKKDYDVTIKPNGDFKQTWSNWCEQTTGSNTYTGNGYQYKPDEQM